MTIDPYSIQYAKCRPTEHAALVAEVLTVQCLIYGVVDVDVDIVQKIVILVRPTGTVVRKYAQ